MTMTALKAWVNLEVLTHTDLNLYIGSGGNLSHMFAELATAAGQLIYSTGSKAVATLAAGTAGQFLRSGGAGAPTWAAPEPGELADAYAVRVYKTLDQTIPVGSSATYLDWGGEVSGDDPKGMHNPSTNSSRLTALIAGWYYVWATVEWQQVATAGTTLDHYMGVNRTGAARGRRRHVTTLTNEVVFVEVSGLVRMNANDYVEVSVVQSGAATTDINSGEGISMFGMAWLGNF